MTLPHPSLSEFIRTKDVSNLTKILIDLPPFEIADMLAHEKDEEENVLILNALPPKLAAGTYKYLSRKLQKLVLHIYPMEKIVALLKNMETDDSIALLERFAKIRCL